jgi:hypothetical protein
MGQRFVVDQENDFRARFITTSATIEWTGRTSESEFVSDPAATSSSSFAEIGVEMNGVFFHQPGVG